jgi:gliding motility-associated-like protein
MTGVKKNFAGVFCKKNYQKVRFFVFAGLVLINVLFSNKLLAQAPTASISLFSAPSPPAVCEPSPIYIQFSATGTPPFTFFYNINGSSQTPLTPPNNASDTIIDQTVADVYTYSLVSVSDGLGNTVPQSGSVTFTVHPTPQSEVTGDIEVCQFDPIVHVKFYGSGGATPYTMRYTQNGVLDTITQSTVDTLLFPVSTSDAGTFVFALLDVVDNNGCTATIGNDTAIVIVDQRPSARFSINPSRVSNIEPTITITNLSVAPANSSWIWDFGDATASYFSDPGTHTYKDTGTYTVKLLVSSGLSCDNNTSQTVRVFLPFSLYVPSAFSPNNDGVNDVFIPKADGIKLKEYDMTIYDRWGNKMFYTDDLNKGWDGTVNGSSKIVQIDAYVYVINLVTDEDGKTYIFYGSVTSTLR